MDQERFEKIDIEVDAFSFGQKQDARSLLSILIMRAISVQEFIEYVNLLVLKSMYESAVEPFAQPAPKIQPLYCPKCGGPLLYRALRNHPLRYRSNFACDECGFDHYDLRSVLEVINEGIRSDVEAIFDPGTTAEPVDAKE